MASLESLPADQRAVLQLVLQRGRGYDDIARMLSIDRAAVRQRALAAFDALGPHTGVPDQRRALITDYLLGQLPPRVNAQTRDRLSESPREREWARVLASELAPLASGPLPEIPVKGPGLPAAVPEPAVADSREDRPARPPGSGPRSGRGGIAVIAGAAVVVIVVVVLIVAAGGSDQNMHAAATSTGSTGAAGTTATTSSAARVIAQISLTPPTAGSKAAGIAEVLKEGATEGIAIVAQNVPANATKPPNAYAIWLYNSPTDAHILGFVTPGVGASRRLSTAGALPTDASHFTHLIVTVETKANPTAPGTIVLQGTLTGLK